MSDSGSAASPEQHHENGTHPDVGTLDGPVQEQEITQDSSIFPSAPVDLYKRYTTRNIKAAQDYKKTGVYDSKDVTCAESELLELVDPPNLEWIEEDGSWNVFGQTWPIDEKLPSLEEVGVRQLYSPDQDRRSSLHALLQAALRIYLSILDALLKPPPAKVAIQNNMPNDTVKLAENLRLVTLNMHHLLNELRPIQAQESLLLHMRRQIEDVRSKSALLRQSCQNVTHTIEHLVSRYQLSTADNNTVDMDTDTSKEQDQPARSKPKQATSDSKQATSEFDILLQAAVDLVK